jgi:chaperonin GroES
MKEHALKLRPLYNRVLLRRLDAKKEEGKSRIIIPDTAKEKPLEGKIVAVGSGKLGRNGEWIPLHVKVGDRVLIGKYSGQEIMIEDVEHLILKEEEILGIIG